MQTRKMFSLDFIYKKKIIIIYELTILKRKKNIHKKKVLDFKTPKTMTMRIGFILNKMQKKK